MFPFAAALFIIALATSGTQTTPALPGGIIAWIICSRAKRNPIGGWLMFYYWQLYSGVLLAILFFWGNIQSYVPENFESGSKYPLFLASVVPGLFLLLIQCAVATLLLSVRTWNMLTLLRWILLASVLASVSGLIIDVSYFPDNVGMSVIALIPEALWLAYLFASRRVRHVFKLHDWDLAVNSIYPPKLKVAT